MNYYKEYFNIDKKDMNMTQKTQLITALISILTIPRLSAMEFSQMENPYFAVAMDTQYDQFKRINYAKCLPKIDMNLARIAFFTLINDENIKFYERMNLLLDFAKLGEDQKNESIKTLEKFKEGHLSIQDEIWVMRSLNQLKDIDTLNGIWHFLESIIKNENIEINERIIAATILADLDVDHTYGGIDFLAAFAKNLDLPIEARIKATLFLSDQNENKYKFEALDILRSMPICEQSLQAIHELIKKTLGTSLYVLEYSPENSAKIPEIFAYMNEDEKNLAKTALADMKEKETGRVIYIEALKRMIDSEK